MSVPVWMLLAFAVWTLLIMTIGVGLHRWSLVLTGRAELNQFPGDQPHGPPFYRRSTRAHANCVENLPVFAAIVFAAESSGAHAPILDWLSVIVVVARVLQTTAHLTSGSNTAVGIRFSFFTVQVVALFWMAGYVAIRDVNALTLSFGYGDA